MKPLTCAGRLVVALVLMFPAALQAHTSMYGGYIVSVKDGDPSAGKPGAAPSITVIRAWGTDSRDDGICVVLITKQYVCFLDGKKLEPADFIKAVKPGMAFRCLGDCDYIRVYSDPGLLPAREGASWSTDGAWTVRLKDVSPLVCCKVGEQADRHSGLVRDVVLHLAVESGRITGGVAVVPGIVSAAWHAVDAAGLTFKDGKVGGAVKVTLRAPGWLINGRPEEACSFVLAGNSATDGVLTGSYAGSVGEKASKGALGGQAQPAKDLRGDLGVWVRLDYDQGGFVGQWTFTRKDGQFIGGPTVEGHRHTNGMVEKGKFQLNGNAFSGEMTGKATSGTSCSVTLQGNVAGDMIYGTFTDAEGKTGRCRGEVRRPDAPPAWGWIEPQLKKQIAKGEYPD